MENKKKPRGLSSEEVSNLRAGALYIGSIVLAVLITFVIVASIAGFFDYTPPTPSQPDESVELSPELSPETTQATD